MKWLYSAGLSRLMKSLLLVSLLPWALSSISYAREPYQHIVRKSSTNAQGQMHASVAGASAETSSVDKLEATSRLGEYDPSSVTVHPTLVQTIMTSEWSPPSPDPTGIAYFPPANTLLISDSEVDEVTIFTGVNLWQATVNGAQAGEFSTIKFSDEPSGVAYNPRNQHLFFTDDAGAKSVYELDPGPDGIYDTDDDIVTSFETTLFSSHDPEGIAYDTHHGHLFIADGRNSEVYEISPGSNGLFDGVPPVGDDIVEKFDTAILGLLDPEGVEFNQDLGTLYIVSRSNDVIVETTRDGTLIRTIDISFLNPKSVAGVAYAPSSTNPLEKSLYLVDRGTDNNSDPDENDGKIYEVSLGPISPGLFIDDVILREGDTGTSDAVFTVTLSSVSLQTVTVDYETVDGSATSVDNDYDPVSGRLIFEPYETSKKIIVPVNGDRDGETDETFVVNLSHAVNAPILVDQGTGTIIHDDGPPRIFQLKQNYPNPFIRTTTIPYTILKAGVVTLKVYDLQGREVRSLFSGFQEAGAHKVDFEAHQLPSGIYLYTMRVGSEFIQMRKMMILK